MRIYIACGLSHVPESQFQEHAHLIQSIAHSLEERSGHTVRYALRDSDPQLATQPADQQAKLCYTWDRAMVEWADLVVAESTFPSTGMGVELQIAAQSSIPIVMLYKSKRPEEIPHLPYRNADESQHEIQIGTSGVSLMALGVPSIIRTIEYRTHNEALSALEAELPGIASRG